MKYPLRASQMYAPSQTRLWLSLFIGILLFAFFVLCAFPMWEDHELDLRFQAQGISVPATLIGYEAHTMGRPQRLGVVPVYAYTTLDGIHLRITATEHGLVSDNDKRHLAKKAVLVTYLPDNSQTARVLEWHTSTWPYLFIGLLFLCLGPYTRSFIPLCISFGASNSLRLPS